MKPIVLVLLAACAVPDAPSQTPLDASAPPTPTLDVASTATRCSTVDVTVTVPASAPQDGLGVWLVSSESGEGAGSCPAFLRGGCLSILPPVTVVASGATSGGTFEVSAPTPCAVGASELSFQAIVSGRRYLSNAATVTLVSECGNGLLELDEFCDDGNQIDGDGCPASCESEPCGDGIVQFGEECDDGNSIAGDGCTPSCTVEFCSDGIVQPALGEQCDDGNSIAGDGCNSDCFVEFCGDGIVQPALGEDCDDGNSVPGDGCESDCTTGGGCGDGILNPGEQCDDGNATDGDGCSSSCQVE